jgi:hypothetical protein
MGKILKRIILPQILVKRHTYYDQEILGTLIILGTKGEVLFSCKTLELAWRDNKRNISAVPLGTYDIVFEHSPKFNQKLWELKGVPNRSEAKIHVANFL